MILCMLELSASDADGDVRCATRVAEIIPYGQFKHRIDSFYSLDRAANQFCLFDSGALQDSYASERVSAWCREWFPRRNGDTASGRVCSLVASTCTASTTTISSISVDVFDDIVNKSMLLDFRILSFKSNVGYDVILTIDTRKIHVCGRHSVTES
jgi:hypothetical protein